MNRSVVIAKCLSEEVRVRIINALSCCDLYVCEIYAMLELPQSTVSRHLKVLKDAGLVEYKKEGSFIKYSLNKEESYKAFLEGFITFSINSSSEYKEDINKIKNRKNVCR